jgi:hypothetical protein
MKCRVVLFYIYSSSHQYLPNQFVLLGKKDFSDDISSSDEIEEEFDEHKSMMHTTKARYPILKDLMEILLKYASWYNVYLAPNPQIVLKGVASSKGSSESRWSELISICSGKVIKLSLDVALRNVSQ